MPYTFHLLMMVLTVLGGIFKALDIFLYPSPDVYLSTTLSLTCFWRSLEPMLLFLCETARGAMVNMVIHVIKISRKSTYIYYMHFNSRL